MPDEEELVSQLIPSDDARLLALPGARVFKQTGTRLVIRIPDPCDRRKGLFIKRYLPRRGFRAKLGRFVRCKALREYRLMREASRRGIRVPEALGAAEVTCCGAWQKGFIVMEDIGRTENFLSLAGSKEIDTKRKQRARTSLAKALAKVHSVGFVHDDLSMEHVLMTPNPEVVHFIDLDNGMFVKNLYNWQRIKNLAQLLKSCPKGTVTAFEQCRFLIEYSRQCGLSRRQRRGLKERVVAVAKLKSEKADNFARKFVWLWQNFAPTGKLKK